ncbi:MAG TPA: cytochrome c [Thermoleophilaceae bacterium]|jgi:cytochrome c1|nr:cytochrome c [Thermoleophilaceae bacterium]
MEIVGFLAPWILVGIAVVFISFSGGPGQAREAYMTRGRRTFALLIVLIYIGIGIAVPAVVIASRGTRMGNDSTLSQKLVRDQSASIQNGRTLFIESCAACHTLAAVNARGITGPDLDNIGAVTPPRVLSAIKIGGTGQMRMPAGLLQSQNAQDVANFVSSVAGK